jgi:malate synthase
MYTDAVMTKEGHSIPESFLDTMVSAFAAIHDLNGAATSKVRNSREGSIYMVCDT